MSFQDIGRKSKQQHSSTSASTSSSLSSPYGNPSQSSISPTSKYRRGASAGTGGAGGVGVGVGSVGIGVGVGVGVVGQPISMNDGEGSGSGSASNEYSSISQAILQYQQNVGILSNIIESIGTANTPQETQLLMQQYNLQTDVIQQLSSKIQLQLEQLEKQTNANKHKHKGSNGSSGSNGIGQVPLQQHRATHLKLTRDYKWVETKYKNLQMDAKRRWDMMRMEQRRMLEEQERKNFEEGLDHDTERLQMQLRDDRIVEEIMREREEEVRNINKGMHQVNEIYKDLANIVSYQQDQIDEVEVTMEQANKNAESGLEQIEKAHAKANESNCVIS